MPDGLPRLLYVADVPVESSQHGSALMFRALEAYPADRLRIIETGLASQPARRLPAVSYGHLPIGKQRWLNTRLHGVYSAWLSYRAPAKAGAAIAMVNGFHPEAVLTVGHGFGWLTGANVSATLGLPLHVVVHDDWPRLSAISRSARGWLDRSFGRVYRAAASRLPISPSMAEHYQRRYGASGVVMYPSRAAAGPVFGPLTARRLDGDEEIVIGYGGNSGPEIMSCLSSLALALAGVRARLVVFGPFDTAQQRELLARSPAITFEGFVPFDQMINRLRNLVDVLFVPMAFDAAQRENMTVSFPSKLADYTATGVPLLIYGPEYSSAVRWAREFEGVAAVVVDASAAALRHEIAALRSHPDRRQALANRAIEAGRECFEAGRVQQVLFAALDAAHRSVRPVA